MDADKKGEIVSSFDVDENLALQIWTKGRSPRLVILNKSRNTRKLIHLSWVEGRDRKLSIKGSKRGQTFNYLIQDFEPALQQILLEYDVRTNFRIKLWKFAAWLEKIVHAPDPVMGEGEMKTLAEVRRSSLWIMDFTESEEKLGGVFRPFFPMNEAEAAAVAEKDLRFAERGHGMEKLFKTGVIRDLEKANPKRWMNPIRVAAAAMLLGFSYCDANGSEFMEKLWDDQNLVFTSHDSRIMGLGLKLAAHIRHFDAAKQVEWLTSLDSMKELQDQGYTRKRRFDFQRGSIGDIPYRVTFYEHEEEGAMALGCEPRGVTLRHKGELIYKFPLAVYEAALEHDTMGGPHDEFYTVTQLAWARQFKDWYEKLTPYIHAFAGLM